MVVMLWKREVREGKREVAVDYIFVCGVSLFIIDSLVLEGIQGIVLQAADPRVDPGIGVDFRLIRIEGVESVIQDVRNVLFLVKMSLFMADFVDVQVLEDVFGWNDIGRAEGEEGQQVEEFHNDRNISNEKRLQ